MELRKHIGIAVLALEQGSLDAERFAEVVHRLRQASQAGEPLDEVWAQPGLLSPAQRAQVRALAEPTLAYVSGSTSEAVTEPAGAAAEPAGHSGPADGPSLTIIERMRGAAREMEPESTGVFEGPVDEPAELPLAGLRYQEQHVIGVGGLGTVTSCQDTLLGRRVALKMPRPDQGTRARRVIEREARIVAGLEHPNIVPVYDAGYLPGVGPFYVMRELTQSSLSKVLRLLKSGDARARETYTPRRLLRFFVQICQAVDYAHARGVLHCDLKPANVLLGNFGECLVVDWGLAFSPDAPGGPQGGTPGFVAPEQIAREEMVFDPRMDVFSLGAILYSILCFNPPFPELSSADAAGSPDAAAPGPPAGPAPAPVLGSGLGAGAGAAPQRAELLARYQQPPVPPSQVAAALEPPREVAPELEEVCLRALALDPAQRPASAAALAAAVDEHLEGTRELERRRVEADSYVACGDELADRCREFAEGRPEQMDVLAALRASTPPWAPAADKLDIWNMEDMVSVTDALRVRTFQAAMTAYEQALEMMPQHEGARRGMAALYRDSLERARRERGFATDVHLAHRAYLQEDGRYLEETRSDGYLRVSLSEGACARLFTLREEGRRLMRGSVQDVRWDAGPVALPAGSYLLEVTAADCVGRLAVGSANCAALASESGSGSESASGRPTASVAWQLAVPTAGDLSGSESASASASESASASASASASGSASAPAPVRYPVRIDAGRERLVHVDISAAATLGADEVLVPGGPCLLGASEPVADTRRAGEVEVATFAIQRWPVTFAQYLLFLDDLAAGAGLESWRQAVDLHLPRNSAGVPLVRRLAGRDGDAVRENAREPGPWPASAPDQAGPGPGMVLGVDPAVALGPDACWAPAHLSAAVTDALLPRLPVFGVSVPSAEAYAAWLSARTGHVYRLPRDSEWEKAARGTDGRAYPWGDHFDPTFCKMRSSRPGISVPEPPGAFEADESPYGVRDMAGGVADWTLPDDGEPVFGAAEHEPTRRLVYSRGGAWCDWPMDCRVSVRRAYWACERSRRVGFRLVRCL